MLGQLTKIFDYCPYRSPTDMGVNMAGYAIVDDEVCQNAAKQEIIRRYYSSRCAQRQGIAEPSEVLRIEMLMKSIEITPDIRKTVRAALEVAERTGGPAVAIELPDGRLVTGKTSPLLGASSAALLNALKALGGIEDSIELISPAVIEPIQQLKVGHMGNHNPRLHTDEVLIALSICAVIDKNAAHAIAQLSKLKGSEAHSTVILSKVDESVFQKLGVNLTCEPKYETKSFIINKGMSQDVVRIAIIGIGNIGYFHAKNICQNRVPRMALAALCDIDREKLKKAEVELSGVLTFCDYRELLASHAADAVIIATPHYLHPPIAVEAFGLGYHVLTEKPAGVYAGAVRGMISAAERSGRVFGIMFNQRKNPLFRLAREIVQSGRLGEPKRLNWIITNWYRTQHYYNSSSWRATWRGEAVGCCSIRRANRPCSGFSVCPRWCVPTAGWGGTTTSRSRIGSDLL